MSARVSIGWRVVDTATAQYVYRSFATKNVCARVAATEPLRQSEALRLLADWLDAGYVGHLVRVWRVRR